LQVLNFHPNDRTVVEVWEIEEGVEVGNPGRSEKVRTEGVRTVNPRRAVVRGGRPGKRNTFFWSWITWPGRWSYPQICWSSSLLNACEGGSEHQEWEGD